MNVLLPNVHGTLTISLCQVFSELGVQAFVPAVDSKPRQLDAASRALLLGASDFSNQIPQDLSNCQVVTVEDLPDLDVDFILIAGSSVQRTVLSQLVPMLERRRPVALAWFCGNEGPRYRWDLVRNLLCADAGTWRRWNKRVVNAVRYYPWVDYDRYRWQGRSDAPRLITCIADYAKRYPDAAAMTQRIVRDLPCVEHETIENCPAATMPAVYCGAAASLHIKPEEGYGYAVIESLACGRPVVAPRRYVSGRAMQDWCVHGESALLFDSEVHAQALLARYFADAKYRHALQVGAAAVVRRAIDNAEQSRAMSRFLENLQPQPAKSLRSHWLDLCRRHRPANASQWVSEQPRDARIMPESRRSATGF